MCVPMFVYGECHAQKILPKLGKKSCKFIFHGFEYVTKMDDIKLKVIKKLPRCVVCGAQAQIARLEIHRCDLIRDTAPRWNFYAVDHKQQLQLLTRDHIVARSLGGLNIQENQITMCESCNNRKGGAHLSNIAKHYVTPEFCVAVKNLHRVLSDVLDKKTEHYNLKSLAARNAKFKKSLQQQHTATTKFLQKWECVACT